MREATANCADGCDVGVRRARCRQPTAMVAMSMYRLTEH
jgi:hypothetical protein